MLKTLRTRTRRIMLITLILVIPSFIFFYGWQSVRDQSNRAASESAFGRFHPAGSSWVNVTHDQMAYAKWALRPQIQHQLAMALMQQSGGGMNYRQAAQQASRLVYEAGDSLTPISSLFVESADEWALDRYAGEHRIRVSEADVLQTLNSMTQGASSHSDVTMRLREMNLGRENAEEYLTRAMRLQRSRLAFECQARAPLFEMWNIYRQQEEKIKLDYAFLDLDTYRAKVDATSETLAAYYAAHEENFRVGTQRQYSYALLRRDALAGSTDVTENECAAYYDENKESFRVPRQTQVRQVFFGMDLSKATTPEARADITSVTRSRAEVARTFATSGGDFAAIADNMSEDPANTAADGTKLGGLVPEWFSKGASSPKFGQAFVDAAAALEVGKVQGPVLVVRDGKAVGYSIVKCEQVKDSAVPALAEVREEVTKRTKDAKLDAAFKQRVDEIESKVAGYVNTDVLARDLKLDSGLTSVVLVTDHMLLPALGSLSDIDLNYLNTQESVAKGSLSQPIQSQDSTGGRVAFVLQLKNEIPTHIPALGDIRAKVAAAYKTTVGRDLLKAAANEVKAAATDAAALKAKAEEIQAQPGSSSLFTRVNPPILAGGEWIGLSRDTMSVTTGTLGMSPVGPSAEEFEGLAVWRIAEIQTPSRAEFEAQVPGLRAGLLSSKQDAFVKEWLADQRHMAKLEPPKGSGE